MEGEEDNRSLSRGKRPATEEDETMELMWEKGPVVVSRSTTKGDVSIDLDQAGPSRVQDQQQQQQHLFMQEDEMASWLHYNLNKDEFYPDLLYSAPTEITPSQKPDIPNFPHFLRFPMPFNPLPVVTSPGYMEVMPVVESQEKLVMPPPPVNELTLISSPGSSIVSYTVTHDNPVLQPPVRPEKPKATADMCQWSEVSKKEL